jgi:hypothetical protein
MVVSSRKNSNKLSRDSGIAQGAKFIQDALKCAPEKIQIQEKSASLGINRKLILTQNPDLINYVLKENHKNYHKSAISAERGVPCWGCR